MLLFLVINSFISIICIDEKVFAAYMIGLSALLASTVALINIRKSSLDNIQERRDMLLTNINNNIIKINVLYSKFDEYQNMLEGIKPVDKVLLSNYEILFKNILDIIIDKDISRYIDAKNGNLFYNLHNSIFMILSYTSILLDEIDKKPQINRTIYRCFNNEQLKILSNVKSDLLKTRDSINNFSKK
jgi:hypothetical protein